MKCYICNNDMKYNPKMIVVFHIEDSMIIIKDVPGYECNSCHEQLFDREVTEKLLKLSNDAVKKYKSDMSNASDNKDAKEMPVVYYAA